MCLAVPAIVVQIHDDNIATVEIGNVTMEASVMLVEDVKPGDYLLIHAGFAIEKIDSEEAQKTISLLEEIKNLDEMKGLSE